MGADGAGVDPGAAVGTEALQHLAADGAEAAADRIRRGAVGRVEGAAGDLVGAVAGALRVGAEAGAGGVVGGGGGGRGGAGGRRSGGEGNAEALGQLFHHFGAQLGGTALLEHGKSRLLAADFGGKDLLREARLAAGITELETDLWTKGLHWLCIMDFIFYKRKGAVINIVGDIVDKQVDKLVDNW